MRRTPRILLATAALAGLTLSALQLRAYSSHQEHLLRTLEPLLDTEQRDASLHRLRREPDPARADAEAALRILADLVTAPPGPDPATRAAARDRMAASRELAAGALLRRPANADAAMVLGAATYLGWSLARDGRLFTQAEAWEAPLERSLELAPGDREPARFLSMAYLEVWRALAPEKRREARELLRQGFEDPGTFDRLIAAWLATASNLEEALDVVPDRPFAWERLRNRFIDTRDWPSYARVTRGWYDALEADFDRRFAEAEALATDGYVRDARSVLLAVLREAPVSRRFAPYLTRLLRRLPPGPVDARGEEPLERWLGWCLTLETLDGCPLPPETVDRLAGLTGPLAPPVAALTALLADDLVKAESLEGPGPQDGLRWGPYYLAKARILLEQGDLAGAADALGRLHPVWRSRPAYWQERWALAEAADDPATRREAEVRLDSFTHSLWPAEAWSSSDGSSRLELFSQAGQGLHLAVTAVPEGAAAVEVRWDGTDAGTYAVRSGDFIFLPLEVARGSHLLEIRTPLPGPLVPGAVALAETPAGG